MTIITGSCEEVLFSEVIDPSSVDLVVTSPPYGASRVYDGGSSDASFDIHKVIVGLARVVKPGGVVVWIEADSTVKGAKLGNVHRHAVDFIDSCKFTLHDTMVWLKGTSSHAASAGKSTRYSDVHETMLVFVRADETTAKSARIRPRTVNLIADRPNKTAGRPVPAHYKKREGKVEGCPIIKQQKANNEVSVVVKPFGVRHNVWLVNNLQRVTEMKHPAVMPIEIALDHIRTWSNEGDLVLDPFAGSGTTIAAALSIGRRAIGVEKSEEYARCAMAATCKM